MLRYLASETQPELSDVRSSARADLDPGMRVRHRVPLAYVERARPKWPALSAGVPSQRLIHNGVIAAKAGVRRNEGKRRPRWGGSAGLFHGPSSTKRENQFVTLSDSCTNS